MDQAYRFTFAGAPLTALPSGGLWWADQALLVVSDLHLGRSERIARLGGSLLPPYETPDTLMRLDQALADTAARMVICLGDSFDDLAAGALDEPLRLWLARLMAGRHWIWVEGNHDPGPLNLGGSHLAEVSLGPLTFRHIAQHSAVAEVSGHYHPKLRVAGQSRPCFVTDGRKLILPAFGTYTGGMSARDKDLRGLLQDRAMAVLTGQVARPVPF